MFSDSSMIGAFSINLVKVVCQKVDVGGERERGGVVPEPHLNLLRVQATSKEDRRARMPETVKSDAFDAGGSA